MHKAYTYALLATCYFAQCFAKQLIRLANCGNNYYTSALSTLATNLAVITKGIE